MYKGIFTAIVTPLNEDGSLDIRSLEELIEFQIENKITGIVPVGTTGESPTLTVDEHIKVVEHTCKTVNGRVKVIAGTGSNNTNEAIELTVQQKHLEQMLHFKLHLTIINQHRKVFSGIIKRLLKK